MTVTSPHKRVGLSLLPVATIIHHYRVTNVCSLQDFRFFRFTAYSRKLHPDISDLIAVQLYSCDVRLSCQASYVPFSSAAPILLYSTGFETTWPRLSCGQQIQLGRCSANWSHFSSGGENTHCVVGVSSVAGNVVIEHACTQELDGNPEVIISACYVNQECGLFEELSLLYVCLTSSTRGNWFSWFVVRHCAPD